MNFSSRMVDWEPAPEDTPLELLAFEAGITPDELRAYLRREVARRRAQDAPDSDRHVLVAASVSQPHSGAPDAI